MNEQNVVLYDGYAQRKKSFWQNLLPRVTKKVLKKKVEEVKAVESVSEGWD